MAKVINHYGVPHAHIISALGTYGVVYRAKDEKTGAIVAAKRVKMEQERGGEWLNISMQLLFPHLHLHSGLPVSSLREIAALQQLNHNNVVKLLCVASGRSLNSVYLIMEYCEHDLATLIDNMPTPFPEPAVKCLMKQLLAGLSAMHAQVSRTCLVCTVPPPHLSGTTFQFYVVWWRVQALRIAV